MPKVSALAITGWDAVHLGDLVTARRAFDGALRIDSNDVVALVGLGAVHMAHGQLRDAVLACDVAIARAPDYAGAWLQRGLVLEAGGSLTPARASFERAALLDPGNAQALAAAAMIAGKQGDGATAQRLATRAVALDPANVTAACALAALEIEDGAAPAAVARLRSIGVPAAAQASTVLSLLADALARTGDQAAAFEAYDRANAAFSTVHARPTMAEAETQTVFISRLTHELDATPTDNWALPPGASPYAAHVFLLGYPRSGTTLVENILASAPDVVALEERPTLRDADEAFLSAGGMARLATLGADEAERFRQAYWARVNAAAGAAKGSVLVDMDPLKGIRLPIIARLFPEARVIVMRRDPRDVVLSCWRTQFAPSAAAFEFVDLERAAEHYAALMTLTEECLARLPLNVMTVRYEALVADFDTTTKALCAFTGIEWSDTLRDFDRTAQMRGVTTASAGQVRRKLYDGSRQWEQYRAQMAPVLPILAPWVERFGYAR